MKPGDRQLWPTKVTDGPAHELFVKWPVWMFGRCRDPRAVVVYLVVRKHADYRTGRCRVSRELLAKEADVSVKFIERGLKTLRELGLLTTTRHVDSRGYVCGVTFHLVLVEPMAGHLSDTCVVQGAQSQDDESVVQDVGLSDRSVHARATDLSPQGTDPLNEIQDQEPPQSPFASQKGTRAKSPRLRAADRRRIAENRGIGGSIACPHETRCSSVQACNERLIADGRRARADGGGEERMAL